MSPEQACGKPTDKRSDIWSFGCIMYQMLTSKFPFEGETATDTVARILERKPDWDLLPKTTPASIRVLLWRCLAKDPQRRLQDMGDVVLELDETLNLPPDKPSIVEPVVDVGWRQQWWLAIAFIVAGVIVGLIAASIFLGPSATTVATAVTHRTILRLPDEQVLALSRSTPLGIAQPAVALSADGSHLVYVADVNNTTQLFLRPMNQLEARPIPGTEGAHAPFFSPDGQSVGFFTKGKLKIVSLLGGEPVALCDARTPKGASWGANGMIYFAEKEGSRLSQVLATGGATEHLKAIAEPSEQGVYSYGYPQILPSGKEILLSSRTNTILFSLETREKEILVKGGQHARYVPTGHLVYARAGAIEAVPFDLATLQVTGPSVPILDMVLMDSSVGTAQLAFSSDGLLVYVPGGDTAKSIPVWVDRQGNVEPLSMPAQIYGTPKISPDGKQLAILIAGPPSNIYTYDIASGRETRLTLEGNNANPVWTPDGKRITFSSDRQGEGTRKLFWKPADGSGEAELLHTSQEPQHSSSWSADGKLLAFFEVHPTTGADVWILSLEGDREPELVIGTEFFEWGPAFSPDGRLIAYISDKDGKFQVYVQPHPSMDMVWQISDDFGGEPIFSPKGDELFYRNGDKWMVVSISIEPEFAAGTPRLLFEGPYINVPGLSYDVAPDAQRFLALQPEYDDSAVRELHVVVNWFEELKRLVPSGKERRQID
ncbi:MAG: protein kinase domain-containing protein, partial [Planctomycetota bacterium]|jgi:serine/threonine-protein kinase